MKGRKLPKIRTVSGPIALFHAYEPLTKRFWLKISGRVPKFRWKRPGMTLFFRRESSRGAEVKVFRQNTRIEKNFFHTTLRVSFADSRRAAPLKPHVPAAVRPERSFEKETSVAYRSFYRRPLFLVKERESVSSGRGLRAAPLQFAAAASSEVKSEKASALLPPMRFRSAQSTKTAGVKAKRLPESGTVDRREVEPLVLHYRSDETKKERPGFSSGQTPSSAAGGETVKIRERHIRSESKEIRIHERREIEKISEKVYTLVMKKWEQERRRRGVLYE